jgi:Flp pilus assembly protein TadG
MAILIPILLVFLAVPIFFARVFWYYSVAQKAAHDATRFLSTATQVEMRTQGVGYGEAPMAGIARAIAVAEIQEIMPVMSAVTIDVQCDLNTCGLGVPQTVRVAVRMRFKDDILDTITSGFYGPDGLLLAGDLTMRYVGN